VYKAQAGIQSLTLDSGSRDARPERRAYGHRHSSGSRNPGMGDFVSEQRLMRAKQLVKRHRHHGGHGGIIKTTGGDDLKEIQEPHHL
jgi:hypothetical protein